MGTPHNSAQMGDIAKTVLMPGDPLRAEFIAKTWLTDVRKVSQVRNIYAFTGKYEGQEITVMASGMGMPSIGIYSYELFTQYGVEQIIRIGSAGAYTEELKLYDVVLADSCWSESSFGQTQNGDKADVKYPNKGLNEVILRAAAKEQIPVKTARIHSSDVFYQEASMPHFSTKVTDHGCACVEMESFALFHNAQVLGKKAACLLTISDSFVTGEKTSVEERQEAFSNMMKIALRAGVLLG